MGKLTKTLMLILMLALAVSCATREDRLRTERIHSERVESGNNKKTKLEDKTDIQKMQTIIENQERKEVSQPAPTSLKLDNYLDLLITQEFVTYLKVENKVIGIKGLKGIFKDTYYVFDNTQAVFIKVSLDDRIH